MTRTEAIAIRDAALEQFQAEIAAMGIKKKALDALSAGFQDGMTAMFAGLRQAGHITLEEEVR